MTPKHFSMIRQFHLADWLTLGNAFCGTGAVFAAWDRVDRGPLGDWREGRNDLEAPAIRLVPQIAEVLGWLRGQPGAIFVRMSGSGATCFALFGSIEAGDTAASACPPHWWHLATRLR